MVPGALNICVNSTRCYTPGQLVVFPVTLKNPAAGSVTNIVYTSSLSGDGATPILPPPPVVGCPTTLAGGATGYCVVAFTAPADYSTLTLTVTATGQTLGGSVTLGATASATTSSPKIASSTSSNPTCANSCNGAISVAASGAGPFTYAWSTGATTAQLTGLCPGSYTVTATDAFGCTVSKTFTLTAPPALSATASGTDASCYAGADGSATVVASGGTAPYSYLWSNGQTGATATLLAAGSYTVVVKDANNCEVSAVANVGRPSELTASATATGVACNGATDGTATAVPSGGTAPYTYLWSNGQTGATAIHLAAGSYTVTVTDAKGCTASAVATVGTPTALHVEAASPTASTLCAGSADATAVAAVSGGSEPYTYLWSNGQTTATATGLAAGTYTVTVTDASHCVATTTTVIIEPTVLKVEIVAPTSTSCTASADATATAVASGATAPYTYLWSNGQTSATATGLAAGTHSVTVRDAHNCEVTETVTITAPPQLSVSVSSTIAACNAATGTATATVSGGTGPFTFVWNNAQTTSTATGLVAATYSVTVTDANLCTASGSVTVGSAACVCTLTQGYWKTHYPGSVRPAADPTWTACNCYTSKLGNCPQTWQWYLNAPARGDAITISAKQYIAAYLSMLKSGLDPLVQSNWNFNTAVGDCFFTLQNVYATTCSVTAKRFLKQRTTSAADVLQCANLLDTFNNGNTTGAPHC